MSRSRIGWHSFKCRCKTFQMRLDKQIWKQLRNQCNGWGRSCDVQLGGTQLVWKRMFCLSHAPRPPAAWMPVSTKQFRRTSRILTHVTFWEWMLCRWEEKESSLPGVFDSSAPLCCFPGSSVDSWRHWITSTKYCVREEAAKNFSRWKNRIYLEESIVDSFGVLIFTLSLCLKSTKFYRKQDPEGWQSQQEESGILITHGCS